jgi:two-component system response regulator AtoC
VQHFIQKYNKKLRTSIDGITSEALNALIEYCWLGNVRELENTIERAMVLSESAHLHPEHLPERVVEYRSHDLSHLPDNELSIKKATRTIERELIRRALTKTSGNRTHAARLLEISHRTLLYKIEDYGIQA